MAAGNTRDIAAVFSRPEIVSQLAKVRAERTMINRVQTDPDEDMPQEFDINSLAGIILVSLNGTGDVPEQTVRVEFLAQDQLLLIPKGLGVHPTTNTLSEASHDIGIVTKYNKASRLTYPQILDLVTREGDMTSKFRAYEAIDVAAVEARRPLWESANYYAGVGPEDAAIERVNFVFGVFSRILRLNCDIRDVGSLVVGYPGMRMGDGDWLTVPEIEAARVRLTSKMMPYTMHMIAALNYSRCKNFAIGAWVRSFGVCCGVLPATNTLLNVEWKYTAAPPALDHMTAVDTVHEQLGSQLNSLCLNILAMFGLLHLNKNHTFITGDASMQRICTSYINTLRTMVPKRVIDDMLGNMEVTCRTAAHPFGLGQTYAVARILNSISGLASPLALRISVTPPLTQRLMIVTAAAAEWEQLPIGKAMSALYTIPIATIKKAIEEIKLAPPAYSELWRLYGYSSMAPVDKNAKQLADALMPVVGGYAKVMHTGERDAKDGIALAMSFLNVERESKAITEAYASLWNKYLDSLEKEDLSSFMFQAFKLNDKLAAYASMPDVE